MFSRRTAVYYDNTLMGKSEFLEAIFFASLAYNKQPINLINGSSKVLTIKNNSDVDYELELVQPGVGFDAPQNITLKAKHINAISFSGNSEEIGGTADINVYYRVKNMYTASNENLVVTFTFRNN